MKVCFIGKHKYPKDIFSNEQDLKTWRFLSVYFDKLFVIAASPDIFFHRAKENNIRIYLIPHILGYFGFITGAVKLGIYLKIKYGVDIFDASEVVGGGIAATILKFITSKPSVVEIQGEIFRKVEKKENLKSRLLKKIGGFVMKKADRIRVISRAIFNQVKGRRIPENKIRLVSLRVDLNLFSPNLSTSDVDNADKLLIGYIGRLVEGKGLEDLMVAIDKLNNQVSNFKVFIYGDGPLKEKLIKMSRELKIEDKIEWRGFVPYGKVPEALSQMDIFVYPSIHEGFGRSIMEALAMERAVIATNVGGIPDLIKNNETGFLVEPHNPEQLAEKIKELMENKGLREKFGKAGREWIVKNFEWNSGIKKFADLFLELK